MRKLALFLIALVALVLCSVPAWAAPHWEADLTWADNSGNEDGFRVERKLGTTGIYSTLTSTAPNVTVFTDVGPYTDGQVVCWRIVAFNAGGTGTSPETCSGAPVQIPSGPGAPAINFRFVPQ